MKYSIPVAFVLCGAFSTSSLAQEVTAPVLADVVQDLVLTSTGQTSFGTIGNGAHIERIDPAAPTPTQQTAQITLSAGAGSNVALTCSSEVILTEPASSAVMTFTPELSVSTTGADQSSSAPAGCSSGIAESPTYWLWLGGSLPVAANQAPGSYSGVFTFSATYF